MKLITQGVYYFTGLTVGRVYLIDDPDGYTLVDTGFPSAGAKILDQLSATGRSPKDVKRILITHAHSDHIGSLPELKAATGAQVIASAVEQPVIEGKIPIPRNRKSLIKLPANTILPPVIVDRPVKDGDIITEVMGGMQVVFTPGHAPGHIAFWQPDRKFLICGDVIFHLFGLRLPTGFLTVDMDENKRSIQRVAALQPEIVCFGHGEPLTQNAAQQLSEFAQRVAS